MELICLCISHSSLGPSATLPACKALTVISSVNGQLTRLGDLSAKWKKIISICDGLNTHVIDDEDEVQ